MPVDNFTTLCWWARWAAHPVGLALGSLRAERLGNVPAHNCNTALRGPALSGQKKPPGSARLSGGEVYLITRSAAGSWRPVVA